MEDAAQLFSRWSQEDFFRYMMEHDAIDVLSDYHTQELPEANCPVVNPPWQKPNRKCLFIKTQLTQRQARFAALALHPEADAAQVPK